MKRETEIKYKKAIFYGVIFIYLIWCSYINKVVFWIIACFLMYLWAYIELKGLIEMQVTAKHLIREMKTEPLHKNDKSGDISDDRFI